MALQSKGLLKVTPAGVHTLQMVPERQVPAALSHAEPKCLSKLLLCEGKSLSDRGLELVLLSGRKLCGSCDGSTTGCKSHVPQIAHLYGMRVLVLQRGVSEQHSHAIGGHSAPSTEAVDLLMLTIRRLTLASAPDGAESASVQSPAPPARKIHELDTPSSCGSKVEPAPSADGAAAIAMAANDAGEPDYVGSPAYVLPRPLPCTSGVTEATLAATLTHEPDAKRRRLSCPCHLSPDSVASTGKR